LLNVLLYNDNNTTTPFCLQFYFLALLAAKCCCGRQVDKRQAAANAVALLSIVGNAALEKMCKVFGGPEGTGRQSGCGPRAVVWPPLN